MNLTDEQKALFDKANEIVKNTQETQYVTITHGIRGYFAVLVGVDAEGFEEPINTGCGSYSTYEDAISEAKGWAECEDVEFRPWH